MVKHDVLKTHLENLRNSIPELRGVLLASSGRVAGGAFAVERQRIPNRVAAMAAAATNLGRRISESHGHRRARRSQCPRRRRNLFIYAAGTESCSGGDGPMAPMPGSFTWKHGNTAKEIGDLF